MGRQLGALAMERQVPNVHWHCEILPRSEVGLCVDTIVRVSAMICEEKAMSKVISEILKFDGCLR